MQCPGQGELGHRGRAKVNPPLFCGRSLAEGGVQRWKESMEHAGAQSAGSWPAMGSGFVLRGGRVLGVLEWEEDPGIKEFEGR